MIQRLQDSDKHKEQEALLSDMDGVKCVFSFFYLCMRMYICERSYRFLIRRFNCVCFKHESARVFVQRERENNLYYAS
jgi:hypothetical protein